MKTSAPTSAWIPQPIRCGSTSLRFGDKMYLMGVLNVTPDSFSDGGYYHDTQKAVDRALHMAEEGADVIDIGGESTRPGADPISLQEELRRVLPVVEKVCRYCSVPVSIDTTKAQVAQEAVLAGASMVNDISALSHDARMAEVVAQLGVPLVLMHMRKTPKDMQTGPIVYGDVMEEIRTHLRKAMDLAIAAGISENRLIVDPGIGFGKTVEHNLIILHRLAQLRPLDRPILVGPSRKSFIGAISNKDAGDRLMGTAAAVAAAMHAGAHMVRVHDVEAMRQVTDVCWSIEQERISHSVPVQARSD